MGIVTLLFLLMSFFDRKRKDKWQDPSREGPYTLSPPSTAAALTLPREGQGGGDTKQLPRCCSLLLSLKFWYFKETTPHFSNHHLRIPVELTRYFDFLSGWVSFWGNRTTQDGFQKEQTPILEAIHNPEKEKVWFSVGRRQTCHGQNWKQLVNCDKPNHKFICTCL